LVLRPRDSKRRADKGDVSFAYPCSPLSPTPTFIIVDFRPPPLALVIRSDRFTPRCGFHKGQSQRPFEVFRRGFRCRIDGKHLAVTPQQTINTQKKKKKASRFFFCTNSAIISACIFSIPATEGRSHVEPQEPNWSMMQNDLNRGIAGIRTARRPILHERGALGRGDLPGVFPGSTSSYPVSFCV